MDRDLRSCKWNLLSHSPHRDHRGRHFPHLFKLFLQSLVLLHLLMLLPPGVAVSWDCHNFHICPLLLLFNHHYVRFVSQQLLVSLEVEVTSNLIAPPPLVDSVILSANVPVQKSSHLFMAVSVEWNSGCVLAEQQGGGLKPSQVMLHQIMDQN